MVNWALTVAALLTGVVMGAVFKFLEVPMPAPPTLPGLMGIVGVYVGYKIVKATGYGVDLLEVLGVS